MTTWLVESEFAFESVPSAGIEVTVYPVMALLPSNGASNVTVAVPSPTDTATFAWLCDVFVDSAHRGDGLGVFLVQSAMDHPDVQGIRLLLLGTRDAHDLYRRFGFGAASENLMERRSGAPAIPDLDSNKP